MMVDREIKVKITIASRGSTVGYWWVVDLPEAARLRRQYDDAETLWMTPATYSADNVAVRGIMEHFFNSARIPAIEAHSDLIVTLEEYVTDQPKDADPCQIPLLPQSLN